MEPVNAPHFLAFWGHRFSVYVNEEYRCPRCGYITCRTDGMTEDRLKWHIVREIEQRMVEPHCGGKWHETIYKPARRAIYRLTYKQMDRRLPKFAAPTDVPSEGDGR